MNVKGVSTKISSRRNWRIGKSGDYRASGGHGPVRVLVESGQQVDRLLRVDSRDTSVKVHSEKIASPVSLSAGEIERRLKGLRIRL